MRTRFFGTSIIVLSFAATVASTGVRADDYAIDTVHSGVTFKVDHLGIAPVQGRFNDFSGTFTFDPKDPSKCSFSATIKAETVDTNNSKRDDHLRGPDFFNVKQFPTMTFKSTKCAEKKGGIEVTGDLTMHGVTKPVTLFVKGGKTAEFPKGVQRVGLSASVTIKRSDFDMDKLSDAIGDEVTIELTIEGTKK
jgi:polyisoprenoid-binding protein YceI